MITSKQKYLKQYYQKNRKRILEKQKEYNKTDKAKKRKAELKKKHRQAMKEKIQQYKLEKGCKECGYKKCPDALEFHHFKKQDKEIVGIGSNTYSHSWTKIKKEIKKCVVLCSNCHKELEYNLRQKK